MTPVSGGLTCPHCGKPVFDTPREIKFSEADISRFWKTVKKSDGCWICSAMPSHTYGRIYMQGRQFLAHVVSWIVHNGPIPPGKKVCHKCDVPRCVRPDHLFLGTNSENLRDMVSKGRNKTFLGSLNYVAKLTEEKVLAIRESLQNQSRTIDEIAKENGLTFQAIYHVAVGNSWKHVGGPLLKPKNPHRLSPDDVIEIRRQASSGIRQADIARFFSVDQGHISAIVNGRRHASCS